MEKRKVLCGGGKEKVFDNGGRKLNLNLCLSDIPEEYTREWKGKKYVNLIASTKRDQSGDNTHYIEVETWRPDGSFQKSQAETDAKADIKQEEVNEEPIPF